MEKIIVGSDHAGFQLKTKVLAWLLEAGVEAQDAGCFDEESVHYPDFGKKVAQAVLSGQADRGIVICGTGIGISIAANRFKGIRATLCHNQETAQMAREHNDSNVLALGARILDEATSKAILSTWLTTPFAGGRHQLRLDLLDQ